MQLPEDKEMAAQLRTPHGEYANSVGEFMAKANERLYMEFCESFSPAEGSAILEIGPGSGVYIPNILCRGKNLNYTAVELSEEMSNIAREKNARFIDSGQVRVVKGNCRKTGFDPGTFDHVFAINTLYFWDPLEIYFYELRRVMKRGAQLCLGYRTKSSMVELSFTKFGFTLYEPDEVEKILEISGFNAISSRLFEEEITSPDGRNLRLDSVFTLASCP